MSCYPTSRFPGVSSSWRNAAVDRGANTLFQTVDFLSVQAARAQQGALDLWTSRRLTPFPKEFIKQIQESNDKKPEAPLILVLQAKYDDEQATFYSLDHFALITSMAKSYRIALKTISSGHAWGKTLRESEHEYGEKFSALYLSGHGDANKVRCNESNFWNSAPFLEISDLHPEDFDSLTSNAVILIDSCQTGQVFAPAMAQISQRTVLGLKRVSADINTVFDNSLGAPRILCYDRNRNQLVYAFFPDGRCELLTIDPEIKKRLFTEKIENYRTLALNGDAQAQYSLAQMLEVGICEQSIEQAVHWYSQAAEQGYVRAFSALARIHSDGVGGIPQSDEEALRLSYLAAERGSASAEFRIGLFYEQGRGGLKQSDSDALHWYRLAAKHGLADAQFAIGCFYEEGRGGLPTSDQKALGWFSQAASYERSQAQYAMGVFHQWGRGGLPASEEIALEWYLKAAEQGMDEARFQVGIFHEQGLANLPKSPEEALRWYLPAANNGYAAAQTRVAFFHQEGLGGLAQSDEIALEWHLKAANQGFAASQNSVGVFYQMGRGGLAQSDEQARSFYQLAADQGEPAAQFNLGFFYEEGRSGLARSDAEALRWYSTAAKRSKFGRYMMGVFYEQGRGGLFPSQEDAQYMYSLCGSEGEIEEIRKKIETLRIASTHS